MLPAIDCSDDRPAPALGRLLDAAALAAVLWLAWRSCGSRHRHRRSGRSMRLPVPVQTWEAEGGRPVAEEHAIGMPTERS